MYMIQLDLAAMELLRLVIIANRKNTTSAVLLKLKIMLNVNILGGQ